MMLAIERGAGRLNLYNLGTDEYCKVNDSIGWIAERLGCTPRLNYAGGERGWVGDSPFIFLDCSRIRALGWRPKLSIREAVLRTVDYLRGNTWVFERR
jgi:UDP-glucose 4-epimerase